MSTKQSSIQSSSVTKAVPVNFFAYQHSLSHARAARLLRIGFWIYFFLLIFEGALRKWVLPSLATPLLLIRDPIALVMVLAGWNMGLLNKNTLLTFSSLTIAASFFMSVIQGHGNIMVALYGARIMLLHFPLIFIIGNILSREQVLQFGKVLLLISIPMVVLISVQFYSPQTSWVNAGVGGEEVRGFTGALGFSRPPGTFSFITGVTSFYGLAAPFVFFFIFNTEKVNKLLLIPAALALLISIPVSITRTLFFSVTFTAIFALLVLIRKPKFIIRAVYLVLGAVVLLVFLSRTEFFQTASNAFFTRFTEANESEGGLTEGVIGNRYLGSMVRAFESVSNVPYFGYGLGLGTNVGSQILRLNGFPFNVEDEFARQIGEMGFLLGLFIIFCRAVLSLSFIVKGYKKLALGDVLPWLLTSFALLSIPQGQWAQPTTLGFAVITGGLILASLKEDETIGKN